MMDFKEGEVLYFNKPLGWTSFKVVGHARYHICRRMKVKKLKVGHAGTLDPLATDRKSTRLNSSHTDSSRMPSSA